MGLSTIPNRAANKKYMLINTSDNAMVMRSGKIIKTNLECEVTESHNQQEKFYQSLGVTHEISIPRVSIVTARW